MTATLHSNASGAMVRLLGPPRGAPARDRSPCSPRSPAGSVDENGQPGRKSRIAFRSLSLKDLGLPAGRADRGRGNHRKAARRRCTDAGRSRRSRAPALSSTIRPEVHDGDPVGETSGRREIVGDHQDAESLMLEPLEQAKNAGAGPRRSSIEDGLVGDEQPRLEHEPGRDRHAFDAVLPTARADSGRERAPVAIARPSRAPRARVPLGPAFEPPRAVHAERLLDGRPDAADAGRATRTDLDRPIASAGRTGRNSRASESCYVASLEADRGLLPCRPAAARPVPWSSCRSRTRRRGRANSPPSTVNVTPSTAWTASLRPPGRASRRTPRLIG